MYIYIYIYNTYIYISVDAIVELEQFGTLDLFWGGRGAQNYYYFPPF